MAMELLRLHQNTRSTQIERTVARLEVRALVPAVKTLNSVFFQLILL
jgi:hypothetical protein